MAIYSRPVVLTFAHYYLPGKRAGGSIRTIANAVLCLSDTFEFRIVASDRDLGDTQPYRSIEPDQWLQCGAAAVRYLAFKRSGIRAIVDIVRSTPHDIVYLNSFFDSRFTVQVLLARRLGRLNGRPIVIAPRGEFSLGALSLKRYKKSCFIYFARLFGLYEGLIWQASSPFEAEDIRRVLGVGEAKGLKGRLVIAGDVVLPAVDADSKEDPVQDVAATRVAGDPLKVCFLSRISPKKNLGFALQVLGRVSVRVRFTIYGPVEDVAYWNVCGAMIAKLPSHIDVVYAGLIEHDSVVHELAQHQLFFFPTRGENFGHVIHEALRAGLPLLISDQTPWRHLVEKGVGWDLPLEDPEKFVLQVEAVSRLTPEELEQSAGRSRSLATTVINNPQTLDANRRMFLDAIDEQRISVTYPP